MNYSFERPRKALCRSFVVPGRSQIVERPNESDALLVHPGRGRFGGLVFLLGHLAVLLCDLFHPRSDLVGLLFEFARVDVEIAERFERGLDDRTGGPRDGKVRVASSVAMPTTSPISDSDSAGAPARKIARSISSVRSSSTQRLSASNDRPGSAMSLWRVITAGSLLA